MLKIHTLVVAPYWTSSNPTLIHLDIPIHLSTLLFLIGYFFFNFRDATGVNIDYVFHYVDNNNPSTSTTRSFEITTWTTLLTKNLAKSWVLSTKRSIFDCPLLCNNENKRSKIWVTKNIYIKLEAIHLKAGFQDKYLVLKIYIG